MPQPNPFDLAKDAYAAYGTSTGGLTHDGRPMPDWDDLGDKVQLAWMAAASAVCLAVTTPPDPADDTQK